MSLQERIDAAKLDEFDSAERKEFEKLLGNELMLRALKRVLYIFWQGDTLMTADLATQHGIVAAAEARGKIRGAELFIECLVQTTKEKEVG